MNKGIIEASDLPEEEKLYLKRDGLGWRIVQPLKNPDGTINWVNFLFGGARNLLYLILILVVIGLFFYGHYEITKNMRGIVENPCSACPYAVGVQTDGEKNKQDLKILNYKNETRTTIQSNQS